MATTKSKPARTMPLPTIGRQGPTSSSKKKSPAAKARNGNIMSFFQKAENEVGLFVEDKRAAFASSHLEKVEQTSCYSTSSPYSQEEEARFNESGEPRKRQRTEDSKSHSASQQHDRTPVLTQIDDCKPSVDRPSGPFLEDSDSEQGDEQPVAAVSYGGIGVEPNDISQTYDIVPAQSEVAQDDKPEHQTCKRQHRERPSLIKEETSYGPGMDELEDFEDMEDFDENLYEDGDEYRERRYMEEQARLEAEEAENATTSPDTNHNDDNQDSTVCTNVSEAPRCPICAIDISGYKEPDVSTHVNNCLDGKPTPLPPRPPETNSNTAAEGLPAVSANQYRRPPRPPRPPQANPFTLGQSAMNGGSAFNRLMSGHAEDAAWAEAAASEFAARGKPSYQRTCPFYKILPGLHICVDAFRYGAVQGCNAYFLSHFHSDHYVGLTSSWSHGPIYCSKVTANLVKQQLRVDPKYVIDLEWERPIEIPGTEGVTVTMISANHCPGSSLYLFEKVVGKKQNGEPRLQRILHCGDFRACRQHVEHPLLMPNVQDKLSGSTKEQKIDVCYLDTTYLNPKYSFPSQEAVISACADMCVSLSRHTVDENDGWEQMKKSRAGEGMVKFVRKTSNPEVKQEPTEEDDRDHVKLLQNPHTSQQVFTTATTPDTQAGRGRLLVVVGTYSIGKERICLGIAKALNSKIYAPPSKQRIVAALEDPELDERMTGDPRAAQVHMTPLFEIRADTLDDYLKDYFPHFTRAVGFRPSGWNYRPPTSRFTDSPAVQTVLHSGNWKSNFTMSELVPQRGSTSRASCFGVPYSEHSSFRELTMFCCALRIEKIIPTVNVGSAKSREKMKAWIERWTTERKKNGPYQLPEDGSW